ncbi:hypothetical protein [Acidovorax sp. sic0104]|uniref:hypothetical protein n=1 Tax=Acidovorax sp. sic0104 TaxID=2854784 RepID=UPI001C4815CD|nr:hypothetical protein [Acidovorax sp. sic0104]MBV7539841.1 hypothetical protein [Acidovorax sp. sic0104]
MTPTDPNDPAFKAAVIDVLGAYEKSKVEEASAKRIARDQAVEDQKKVSYYEVLVNAFINSAMELDKSLLTLASGAIAFSLTLVDPVSGSILFLTMYLVANFLFLVTIVSTLLAYGLNKTYVSDLINTRPNTARALTLVDRTAVLSFGSGVFLLTIVGCYSVIKKWGMMA